jgi:hypothetical protein
MDDAADIRGAERSDDSAAGGDVCACDTNSGPDIDGANCTDEPVEKNVDTIGALDILGDVFGDTVLCRTWDIDNTCGYVSVKPLLTS